METLIGLPLLRAPKPYGIMEVRAKDRSLMPQPAREPNAMDGHITVERFLELVPISAATLRRRLADGTIPKYQPGGRRTRVLIPISALRDQTETQSSRSTEEPSNPKSPTNTGDSEPIPGPRPSWKRESPNNN